MWRWNDIHSRISSLCYCQSVDLSTCHIYLLLLHFYYSKWFHTEKYPSDDFILANEHELTAKFSGLTGLIKSMSVGSTELAVDLDFITYGTVSTKEKSGAYLFLPNGEAKTIVSSWSNPPITIIIGPLVSVVQSTLDCRCTWTENIHVFGIRE